VYYSLIHAFSTENFTRQNDNIEFDRYIFILRKVIVGGNQKNLPETKNVHPEPTSEVPSDFLKLHFFVDFFFLFFCSGHLDMPLRGGARSSQKVTVSSQNSTLFGPFSM